MKFTSLSSRNSCAFVTGSITVKENFANQSNPAIPEGFIDNYKKAQATVDGGISADREQMIQAQMDEAAAKGPDALKQLFTDLGKAGY